MAWTSPRTWVDGELVTAALMNTHVRDNLLAVNPFGAALPPIYKTADQSVTSSTVLVDDTHLQFAIGANQAFTFRFVLCTTGPGFLKVALNAPASATGWWQFVLLASASGTLTTGVQSAATFVDAETSATQVTPGIDYLDGYCLNAGTPGTFKLRWAQSSSSGTATILKKGSFVQPYRVT